MKIKKQKQAKVKHSLKMMQLKKEMRKVKKLPKKMQKKKTLLKKNLPKKKIKKMRHLKKNQRKRRNQSPFQPTTSKKLKDQRKLLTKTRKKR